MKHTPLLDKVLRNALHIPQTNGQPTKLILRCEYHGGCTDPFGPTVGNCEECNIVWLIIRETFLTDLEHPDESPRLETLSRVVANACQSERAGTLDFQHFGLPTVRFVPDEDPADSIIFTDA